MQRMFSVLLCIGLLVAEASLSASAGESKPPLQVTVEVSKDGSTMKRTVANASNTYQIYESMTCSWEACWRTDDPNVRVMGPQACARNFRYFVLLAPGEKRVETTGSLLFRGKPGKRTIRFGYSRQISDFTSAELQRLYHSPEEGNYFSLASTRARFKPAKETFWSAPVTVSAPLSSLWH
jgi:hypothetical protein